MKLDLQFHHKNVINLDSEDESIDEDLNDIENKSEDLNFKSKRIQRIENHPGNSVEINILK